MEECLERTTQGPGELLERAAELRFEAGRTDIDGYRDADLVLADRYEQAAARRHKSA